MSKPEPEMELFHGAWVSKEYADSIREIVDRAPHFNDAQTARLGRILRAARDTRLERLKAEREARGSD